MKKQIANIVRIEHHIGSTTFIITFDRLVPWRYTAGDTTQYAIPAEDELDAYQRGIDFLTRDE